MTTTEQPSIKDRLRNNYNRVKRLNMQRAKNIRYAKDVDGFIPGIDEDLDPVVITRKKKLKKDQVKPVKPVYEDLTLRDMLRDTADRFYSCCGRSVGQVNANDKTFAVAVKTGQFCNHRLCNICNSVRAKKLRRKFFAFFNNEEANVPLEKKYWNFFPSLVNQHSTTVIKGKKNPRPVDVKFVSGTQITEAFDFMHLTLTVPHKNGVWQGKEYYAKELLQLFHTMRKCDWWTKSIFGGEQCVETVQTENNLHIHIHALILVKRGLMRSRNNLLLQILKKWNELTIDHTLPTDQATFTDERKQGIKKMLQFLRPANYELFTPEKKVFGSWLPTDPEDWFNTAWQQELYYLDARGSTMVGLNNLYTEISAEAFTTTKSGKFQRDGKFYRYINPREPKELMKGVLECLKYHFEPCSLEDENGNLNTPLLTTLLPNIYRQRLYGKFGGFYGLKQLNVTEEPLSDEDMADFTETASIESYCPITGNPCRSDELQHVVFDLKDLRFDADGLHYYINPNKIKFRLQGGSLREALLEFISIVTDRRELNKQQDFHRYNKHSLN